MGIKKIMCCCGSGLGSSLMIRLNVEKALKKLGISLESKKRTSKDIAEASISSLTDIEMADIEDSALKDLVKKKKEKEGGIKLNEQS